MRNRLLGLILLLCLGKVSLAQAPPVLFNPGAGEIQIQGKIAIAIPAESRVVLSVSRSLVNGAETKVDPPRLKSVVIATNALWRDGGKAIPKPELSSLRGGMPVTAVGKPVGSVNELSARALLIDSSFIDESRKATDRTVFEKDRAVLARTSPQSFWDIWLCTKDVYAYGIRDDNALKVMVTQAGKQDWEIQVVQWDVPAREGHTYAVKFRARADTVRPLHVKAQNPVTVKGIGLDDSAMLGKEWKNFEYTFIARGVDRGEKSLLPLFLIGNQPGAIWIADVSVTEVPTGTAAATLPQP